jgi:hypothetical protein
MGTHRKMEEMIKVHGQRIEVHTLDRISGDLDRVALDVRARGRDELQAVPFYAGLDLRTEGSFLDVECAVLVHLSNDSLRRLRRLGQRVHNLTVVQDFDLVANLKSERRSEFARPQVPLLLRDDHIERRVVVERRVRRPAGMQCVRSCHCSVARTRDTPNIVSRSAPCDMIQRRRDLFAGLSDLVGRASVRATRAATRGARDARPCGTAMRSMLTWCLEMIPWCLEICLRF